VRGGQGDGKTAESGNCTTIEAREVIVAMEAGDAGKSGLKRKPTEDDDDDGEGEKVKMNNEGGDGVVVSYEGGEGGGTGKQPPVKRVKTEEGSVQSEMGSSGERHKDAVKVSEKSLAADDLDNDDSFNKDNDNGDSNVTTTRNEDSHNVETETHDDDDSHVPAGKERPPAEFVLKCHMSVRVQGSDLAVELAWLGGQDIQLMHQLLQFLKNKLALRKIE
jgi:hypothetical protein